MPRPALDLEKFDDVVRATSLLDRQTPASADDAPRWDCRKMAGRLVELVGTAAGARLTVAMGLVCQAQRAGDPAAWVCADEASFFPPDVARGGIDLGALPVVRTADNHRAVRAADRLARSGAFGVVVVDLDGAAKLSDPMGRRLLKRAETRQCALVCVTSRPADAPAISSLVSLRARCGRRQIGENRFLCRVDVVRDKRGGPGWSFEEVCCGPPGLR